MSGHHGKDIIVVAASAGGLMPLRAFLAGLPADLPASVVTVLHIPANGGQALPGILDRSGPLAAKLAVDGEKLVHGRVYVAPADHHVLIVNGTIRLSQEPRQNGVRPAADPLFRRELQSTNDELQEINEELRRRTEEVNQTNDFLGAVFRSLGNAVIVLTEELCVKVWSPGAEEMWGLRADEAVGKSLLALDIGLPTEVVAPHLRTLLNQAGDGWPALELTAVNRRGKTVSLRIAATPLRTEEGATSGFIVVIDHVTAGAPQAEQQIRR